MTLFLSLFAIGESTVWNCNREWPELELLLPLDLQTRLTQLDLDTPVEFQAPREDEWRHFFLQSLYLFWPLNISKTKLRFLIDEEEKNRTKLSNVQPIILDASSKIPGGVSISFNSASDYYGGKGWNRQQLLMFYPDNFSTSEFVGFVDSDCVFTTYIDREDLFESV